MPGMNKPAFNKPGKPMMPGRPTKLPVPKGISPDDRILRTMPITEKQLGQIKKHYGIK